MPVSKVCVSPKKEQKTQCFAVWGKRAPDKGQYYKGL